MQNIYTVFCRPPSYDNEDHGTSMLNQNNSNSNHYKHENCNDSNLLSSTVQHCDSDNPQHYNNYLETPCTTNNKNTSADDVIVNVLHNDNVSLYESCVNTYPEVVECHVLVNSDSCAGDINSYLTDKRNFVATSLLPLLQNDHAKRV